LSAAEAKQFLPSLVVAADGDAIGPRPMPREMRALEPPATTEALELLITDRSDPDRRRCGSGPPPGRGLSPEGGAATEADPVRAGALAYVGVITKRTHRSLPASSVQAQL